MVVILSVLGQNAAKDMAWFDDVEIGYISSLSTS